VTKSQTVFPTWPPPPNVKRCRNPSIGVHRKLETRARANGDRRREPTGIRCLAGKSIYT